MMLLEKVHYHRKINFITNFSLETRQLVRHLWKWAMLEIHAINYKKLQETGRVSNLYRTHTY